MDEADAPEPGFPSFRYGPNDQAEIFHSSADVPKGWEDHPSKVKAEKADEAPKTGLSALRKEFKALTGKNPSPRLNADDLAAKIAALAPVAE
jgi:hypothetical protein